MNKSYHQCLLYQKGNIILFTNQFLMRVNNRSKNQPIEYHRYHLLTELRIKERYIYISYIHILLFISLLDLKESR